MADIELTNVQNKSVRYTAWQGNELQIPLVYKDSQGELQDISGDDFYGELTDKIADKADQTVIHTFSQTLDANGSGYVIDVPNSMVTFILGDELTEGLKPNKTYYLEVKRVDTTVSPEQNKRSFLIQLKFKAEYSRATN